MKSAYELAMERLNANDPEGRQPLSEEQKAELQQIDQRYRAKIAEREVFLQKQLVDARGNGDFEAISQLEKQLSNERARLEDEREAAKEKVRKQAQA